MSTFRIEPYYFLCYCYYRQTCDQLLLVLDYYYIFVSSRETFLVLLKLHHTVIACFYVVLFSSFHFESSLAAFNTPSYLVRCSPLSSKYRYPSKTPTSLYLHALFSFSSGPKDTPLSLLFLSFAFFSFVLLLAILYACLVASSHLDKHWLFYKGTDPVNINPILSGALRGGLFYLGGPICQPSPSPPSLDIISTIIFIIFWDFLMFYKFSFHHKWNDAWLLLKNMVYTSYLTNSRTT